jgi:hypothetical protein
VASFFNRALRKAVFLLVVPVIESFFFLQDGYFFTPIAAAWVAWVLLAERKKELVIAAHLPRFATHLFFLAAAVVFPRMGWLAVASAFLLWISPRALWAAPMRLYSMLLVLAAAVRPLVLLVEPQLSAPLARSTSLIAFQLSQPFTRAADALNVDAGNAGLDAMILIAFLVPTLLAVGGKKLTPATYGAFVSWAMLYVFIVNAVRVAVLGLSFQWLVPTLGIYGFFSGTRSLWAGSGETDRSLSENPI